MKRPLPSRTRSGFTLVELLVVIAMIALLVGLVGPSYTRAIQKAQSTKCGTNLRNIGVAASLSATDNNNMYPEINQVANANPPVYDVKVLGLLSVLGPYGVNQDVLLCPTDQALGAAASCKNASYPNPGSSYEWNPVFDDEVVGDNVVYPTPTNPIRINSSRVRLCTDFTPLHHGRQNAVYGDGHVNVH